MFKPRTLAEVEQAMTRSVQRIRNEQAKENTYGVALERSVLNRLQDERAGLKAELDARRHRNAQTEETGANTL